MMFRKTALAFAFLPVLQAVAQSPATGAAQPNLDPFVNATQPGLDPFFNRIWRIDGPTPYPHSASIYIFLRNGTVLETSCVETYRVATWKSVPDMPGQLVVTEDGRPAFTATVASGTARNLDLRQVMLLGDKAARNLKLTAIDKEFVCPDMPK